ncbi:MAG: acyl carrier protein [bacterium]|nr:acyl carrier protein [bacterium]
MTDTETIRARVIELILAESDEDLTAADVGPETSLREDLDLSSMQAITMMMDLEDEFGIEVEDEELEQLRTIGDVLSLLDSKRGAVA